MLTPLLLSGGIAQDRQPPLFRSRTLSVRVDVLVTDGRKPVVGLTAADFELRDNGVVQTVEVLDTADVPLNVVLALDTSASIAGKRATDLTVAAHALLDGLNPADRAALVTFSHVVTPAAALTSNFAAIRKQLLELKPSGRTAVIDAVYVALATTVAEAGRSLVVVYTDGADVSSWLELGEILESVKRSSAVLYAVTTDEGPRAALLGSLTRATGGVDVRVGSSAELRAGFHRILQEFRSRYILAFTPSGVTPGGVHRLDVRVRRGGVTVNARPTYVGQESGR